MIQNPSMRSAADLIHQWRAFRSLKGTKICPALYGFWIRVDNAVCRVKPNVRTKVERFRLRYLENVKKDIRTMSIKR